MNRRDLLKRGITGAAGALSQGVWNFAHGAAKYVAPNILIIMVDEMRALDWIPSDFLPKLMPNLHKLKSKSAQFNSYFTAASACSAARGSFVTGLYAHQTGVLTNFPSLEELPSEMPTYGHTLRALNYDTYWFGKWHLASQLTTSLEKYGFSGGTWPDPVGYPWQGRNADPNITDQFKKFLLARPFNISKKKWCATVSLINPHDVTGFYIISDLIQEYANEYPLPAGFLDDAFFSKLNGKPCPNFENPNTNGKPALQLLVAQTLQKLQGEVSFDPNSTPSGVAPFEYWQKQLQFYAYLHSKVDLEIGRILTALENSPYLANTIVLFTSDHGDYAGAHGMKGKNGSAYEEAIKVPLLVYDPTGNIVKNPQTPRTQMFSHIDFVPLLMTIANGGDNSIWRSNLAYSHLKNRADLHGVLQNSLASGRNYILFTTDEWLPGLDLKRYHVVCYRTPQAKLVVYSEWRADSMVQLTTGQEVELYDYRSGDFSELNNLGKSSPLFLSYYNTLFGASGNAGLWDSEINIALKPVQEAARQALLKKYFKYVGL